MTNPFSLKTVCSNGQHSIDQESLLSQSYNPPLPLDTESLILASSSQLFFWQSSLTWRSIFCLVNRAGILNFKIFNPENNLSKWRSANRIFPLLIFIVSKSPSPYR